MCVLACVCAHVCVCVCVWLFVQSKQFAKLIAHQVFVVRVCASVCLCAAVCVFVCVLVVFCLNTTLHIESAQQTAGQRNDLSLIA